MPPLRVQDVECPACAARPGKRCRTYNAAGASQARYDSHTERFEVVNLLAITRRTDSL